MPLGSVVNERRYGDLAELFLTPDQRKQAGRETFTVRRQAENQSLLDDAPAPVHVTGHSMVQPYFGFPQKLSNVLDRPVSVNWKPGNVGHWVMLLEYLESPAFQPNTPQVLVWQMFEPTYAQGPDAKGLWDNASIMGADTWRSRMKAAPSGKRLRGRPAAGDRAGLGRLVPGRGQDQPGAGIAVRLGRRIGGQRAEQGPAYAPAGGCGHLERFGALPHAGRPGGPGGDGWPAVAVLPRRLASAAWRPCVQRSPAPDAALGGGTAPEAGTGAGRGRARQIPRRGRPALRPAGIASDAPDAGCLAGRPASARGAFRGPARRPAGRTCSPLFPHGRAHERAGRASRRPARGRGSLAAAARPGHASLQDGCAGGARAADGRPDRAVGAGARAARLATRAGSRVGTEDRTRALRRAAGRGATGGSPAGRHLERAPQPVRGTTGHGAGPRSLEPEPGRRAVLGRLADRDEAARPMAQEPEGADLGILGKRLVPAVDPGRKGRTGRPAVANQDAI
ncbi:hypothetical protein G6F57_013956 [Rhizopus arrhizus]|nr:hypothetical protein G6F57_013956 [Rhizopus arrhizus]